MMKNKVKKVILGRYEKIALPEFEIKDIDAKIDTGAASTSLHAHKVWIEKIEDQEVLKFQLFDPKHAHYDGKIHSCTEFKQRSIRSSNGKKEKRYVIKTTVILGKKKRKTDINLSNRKKMRFPVLVGRKLLRNGFMIDVALKYNLS